MLDTLIIRNIKLHWVDVRRCAHAGCCNLALVRVSTAHQDLVIWELGKTLDNLISNACVSAPVILSLLLSGGQKTHVTNTMVLRCVVTLDGRETRPGRDISFCSLLDLVCIRSGKVPESQQVMNACLQCNSQLFKSTSSAGYDLRCGLSDSRVLETSMPLNTLRTPEGDLRLHRDEREMKFFGGLSSSLSGPI